MGIVMILITVAWCRAPGDASPPRTPVGVAESPNFGITNTHVTCATWSSVYAHETRSRYVSRPRVRTQSVALGVSFVSCSVSLVSPRTRAGKDVRSSYGVFPSTTPAALTMRTDPVFQNNWKMSNVVGEFSNGSRPFLKNLKHQLLQKEH